MVVEVEELKVDEGWVYLKLRFVHDFNTMCDIIDYYYPSHPLLMKR